MHPQCILHTAWTKRFSGPQPGSLCCGTGVSESLCIDDHAQHMDVSKKSCKNESMLR
jgi:hypothetical protein